MDKQEIFDRVVRHLRTQGRQAWSMSGGCQYRTPDGLKCAVGCLIPDELYKPEMEGCTLYGLTRNFSLPDWMDKNAPLLSKLQATHDLWSSGWNENEFFSSIRPSLKRIADGYHLSDLVLYEV